MSEEEWCEEEEDFDGTEEEFEDPEGALQASEEEIDAPVEELLRLATPRTRLLLIAPDPTRQPPQFLSLTRSKRMRGVLDHPADRMEPLDYVQRCIEQVLAEYGAFYKEVCSSTQPAHHMLKSFSLEMPRFYSPHHLPSTPSYFSRLFLTSMTVGVNSGARPSTTQRAWGVVPLLATTTTTTKRIKKL